MGSLEILLSLSRLLALLSPLIDLLKQTGLQVGLPAGDLSALLDQIKTLGLAELRAVQGRITAGMARLDVASNIISTK